jgi:hypothetical protein
MNNYGAYKLPERNVARACLGCERSFLPNKCELHCTNKCCQDTSCENARRSARTPREEHKKCIVCHKPASQFERFAPCTRACVGTVYFQSSTADPNTLGTGLFRRRFASACHLNEPFRPEGHKPDKPPRKHIDYCGLRCYNSVAFGHETRRLDGDRRRRRRADARRGGEPAVPGWRNRWRQEQGYFKEYQRRKRMKERNLLLYGDDSSEAELRAREAAQNDPDWQEVFGDKPSKPLFS